MRDLLTRWFEQWFEHWFEPRRFENEAERNSYIRTGEYRNKRGEWVTRKPASGFEGVIGALIFFFVILPLIVTRCSGG
jgi:hypothetical protein